jgi:3',5'-cyclic AMP phosphodiesterase CpdA
MSNTQMPHVPHHAAQSLRILHLSDIHFGFMKSEDSSGVKSERSSHHFVTSQAGKVVPDPHRLASLLREVGAEESPEWLVISGDISWSGVDTDYEYAYRFIQELRSQWKEIPITIVPGNHDLDLAIADENNNQSAFLKFAKKIYGKDFDATYPLLDLEAARNLSLRERLVSVQRIHGVAFAIGVNTAAHITAARRNGPIYVSPDLLRHLTDYLSENGTGLSEDMLNIFIMHHHLLPFVEPREGNTVDYATAPSAPDPTIVANSAQIQGWLARNAFDLVLHGHKHMPHGRSDRLWRREHNRIVRHTFIVGAGTAGVSRDHIPRGEGLSINQLKINRIDTERWSVGVRVRGLYPEEPGSSVRDLFSYASELGPEPDGRPATFVSQRMDLCHQAIAGQCGGKATLRNFVSVVSDPRFVLPGTARIGEDAVTQNQVDNCFRVLHPEYEGKKGYGWGKAELVQDRLRNLSKRFAFQHGPRIFGVPEGVHADQSSPAEKALEALDISETRGYLSLINTETDLFGERGHQPMPGLVGIQFIRRDGFLDLVATFRSLELSFWWVVNMYETSRLLHWAARHKNMAAGTITFFSPVAVWRTSPRPSAPTDIDEFSVSQLANLALSNDVRDIKELCRLIDQKISHTSVFDLDCKGLQTLAELLRMKAVKDGECIIRDVANDVADLLSSAVDEIQAAIKMPRERAAHVEVAEGQLTSAYLLLQRCCVATGSA